MFRKSPRRFGLLLKKAIRTIAATENKHIGIIQDELGYALGRDTAGSSIRYWSKGHIPADLDEIERLVQFLVERNGFINRADFYSLVHSAEHPQADDLVLRLWPDSDQKSAVKVSPGNPSHLAQIDLIDVPFLPAFDGRQAELTTLRSRLATPQTRLVGIFGMGGIGKTALAVKLIDQINTSFDCIIWRSVKGAPRFDDILRDWLYHLSEHQESRLPSRLDQKLSRLMTYLSHKRCLLILDNLETILREDDQAGRFKDDYVEFERLIHRICLNHHQSCLILTSREMPAGFAALAGQDGPAYHLELQGLDEQAGRTFLREQGLQGNEGAYEALIARYSGNPLALALVSGTINQVFGGRIDLFLRENVTIFGDIRQLIREQFERLSDLAQQIMYFLAVEQEPVSVENLGRYLGQSINRGLLLETLQNLRQRSLIESYSNGLALQQVILEYLIDRLIPLGVDEFINHKFQLLRQIALTRSKNKEYIRQSQQRLILHPIAQQLVIRFGDRQAAIQHLTEFLELLRRQSFYTAGYTATNTLHLLIALRADLTGQDLSHLVLYQAYLKNVFLHQVSLAGADLEDVVFTDTFDSLVALTVSPDGQLLAGATEDRELRVWQADDLRYRYTCHRHDVLIWSICFSPDSQLIALGRGDGAVHLYEAEMGRLVQTLFDAPDFIRSVAFSPDGQWVAAGGHAKLIRIWEVKSGRLIRTLTGHTDLVWSVAFHPDGSRLVSGSADQTIRLWNLTEDQTPSLLRLGQAPVSVVAFSPDGRYLAGADHEGVIGLWDFAAGSKPIFLSGHTTRIRVLTFSPDSSWLASAGEDQVVRLWAIPAGRCARTLPHTNRVWAGVFYPDGATFAASDDDRSLRLWDAQTGQCQVSRQGYASPIWSVACHPNGRILAGGCDDEVVRLWDLETRRQIGILYGHTNWVWSVAFSPDGRTLVSGSADLTIRLWDWQVGECRQVLTGHTDWPRLVIFSPDGQMVASCSDDGTVCLWDLETGACLKTLTGHQKWVWSVLFHPDGETLISAAADESIRVWDVHSGLCQQVLKGHNDQVYALALHPGGQSLASGGHDHTVRLWDLTKGGLIQTLTGHKHEVRVVQFGTTGRTLYSGSADGVLCAWDVETGGELWTVQAHSDCVMSLSVTPSGEILVSSGSDGTIKLWEIPIGRELALVRPDRPYEGLDITGATGLSALQRDSLKRLGAIEAIDDEES